MEGHGDSYNLQCLRRKARRKEDDSMDLVRDAHSKENRVKEGRTCTLCTDLPYIQSSQFVRINRNTEGRKEGKM